MEQQRIEGVVISSTGSWYRVATENGELDCRIRGRLRLKGIRSTNPVVVGDRVMVEPDDESSAIVEILPRRNYIIRRASNLSKESHIIGANIDRALLIVTLHSPSTPVEFVDRFLVTCEAYNVPVTIVLGKADTLTGEHEAEAEEFTAIYQDAGYDLIRLSSTTGEGIAQIRELLKGHTTLIAGNSGVGKSTLVSVIDPELDIRTGEISESHHKGKHTTTFSTMYRIEEGYIIDTPGIKGFGLIDIDSKELCRYFPEMMRLAPDCRFYNCTHTHEPGCAVQEGVKQGIVAWSRYESYLKILDEDDKYRK
ncbi:MAG: ribosome small subunit-dependent GTPase A [Alistipes sp.]|nr:ribosome small subunit-dependent GTPase A [Alistipes sp.]MBR5131440.1 ribosome small subunit-dependent GTPase A [Alistipes sp.]